MKKSLILILVGLIILFSASKTSAFGWGWGNWKLNNQTFVEKIQEMFERWAKILGISVDKIKNYWSEGKTIKEIMEAEGISEDQIKERMKEQRLEEIKSFLQILVDKGIITKEQMEKRLEFERKLLEEKGIRRFHKKFWRFGFGWPKW